MALDAVRSTLRKLEQTSKARNLGAIGLTPTLVRYQRRAHDELIEAEHCVEDDMDQLYSLLGGITIAQKAGASHLTPVKQRIGSRVKTLIGSDSDCSAAAGTSGTEGGGAYGGSRDEFDALPGAKKRRDRSDTSSSSSAPTTEHAHAVVVGSSSSSDAGRFFASSSGAGGSPPLGHASRLAAVPPIGAPTAGIVRRVSPPPGNAAAKKKPKSAPYVPASQATLGNFFGSVTTKLKTGNTVTHEVIKAIPKALPKGTEIGVFTCSVPGCERTFSSAGPKQTHENAHVRRLAKEAEAAAAAAERARTPAKKKAKSTNSRDSAASGDKNANADDDDSDADDEEDGDSSDVDDDDDDALPPAAKLCRDGSHKRSRGAAHRKRYSIIFKLTLLDQLAALESDSLPCSFPVKTVAARYGIAPSVVSRCRGQEQEIRKLLTTKQHENNIYKGAIRLSNSKEGRRMQLNGGRSALFPLAEQGTFDEFKRYRENGCRVSGQMLRILMKSNVKLKYGNAAAGHFKSSKKWLNAFSKRYSMSLRRKKNAKNMSAEERLPKIKRWHARFRRRLIRRMTTHRTTTTTSISTNLRGGSTTTLVSSQASHRETPDGPVWPLDCGLCAAKNVTSDKTLTLPGILEVARRLQAAREPGDGANFLDEGSGNFNGRAIIEYLEINGYHCVTALGHTGDLIDYFCIILPRRILGVMWHIGDSALTGHWVGASFNHTSGGWYFKDSQDASGGGGRVQRKSLSDIKTAMSTGDHFIILDCRSPTTPPGDDMGGATAMAAAANAHGDIAGKAPAPAVVVANASLVNYSDDDDDNADST